MGRYRRHKKENYTHIDNHVFMDHSLSLKAKGLLTQIYSLPDDWEYSVKGLVTLFSDGKDAVNNALQELIEHGYIVRTQRTNEFGKFDGYEYDIYEEPHISEAEFPFTENPSTENPITENPTQLNTNKENTKELNTKLIEKEKIQKKEKFDAIKVVELNEEISSDSELLQAWKDFIEFRKAVKPIKTMQGFTKLLNKLRDLSNGNHQIMIDILNQSIEKEWLGLFELEKKRTSYQPKQAEDNWDKFMKGEHIESHSEFDDYL
jgi:hypothetical protein